jgi:hypothetical protein
MTWYEFLLFVHISTSVGLLIAMAAIFALGLAWAITAFQAIQTPGEAPA